MYPLKFTPVYKDYIWGGRNLENLGKKLPEGIVAESWEISCHSDGISIVENGNFKGEKLPSLINKFGREIVGNALPQEALEKFPLLVKLIDANDKLSVQVHPEDEFAKIHENGELGKNEMWYIMSAKPGAKLIYDVTKGTTKEIFAKAVENNNIESCLNYIEVAAGDFLNIPAGLVHAIGEGIVLAEIQQNSNTTYRVFDYNRRDAAGNTRPLHIEKALTVINFNENDRKEKYKGLKVALTDTSSKSFMIVNKYFCIENLKVSGTIEEEADGERFFLYVFTNGDGKIKYDKGELNFTLGDSVLIPASLGKYTLQGEFSALKSYVPDIEKNVLQVLINYGYTHDDIRDNVAGII